MQIISRRVRGPVDAAAAFTACFADGDHPWLLDSALAGDAARYSYLGSADGPLARVATLRHGRPGPELRDAAGTRTIDHDLLDLVAADLARLRDTPVVGDEPPPGFRLGWVGYLGYEYGMRLLTGLGEPDDTPEAVLVFADRAVVVDAVEGRAWVLALTDAEHRGQQQAWVTATADRLPGPTPSPPDQPGPVAVPDVSLRHPRAEYLALVDRCLEHIAAGDSYELCLTNRITVTARTDPRALYHRLRDGSPRPFAAYLGFGAHRVLSASPERFLSVDPAGGVEAKPIKGTRPRGDTPAADRALAADLAADEKELAENLMIVDLLRNDLNRVCTPGSVHVPTLFAVETYPGVHQLVSTVRGRLRVGLTAVDAVRAALPGGSMTGAPKHRSVQLLHELENGPRGVYSGVIGYFSLDGAADWSIAIRAVVWHPDRLTYGTGGAITAGSTPQREWDETVVKARTLGTALGLDLDAILPGAPATGARPGTHRWWAGRLDRVTPPASVAGVDDGPARLLVADSWRQVAGRVQRLDLHRARFVHATGHPDAGAFFDAAAAAVPGAGEWFPRVRLVDGGFGPELLFDLRPGPARSQTARVRVLDPGDPRTDPRVKGPDLGLAGELIADARRVGADEVLIRAADGTVLEAGWAAVVWWDGDTLMVPDSDLPILPSITRRRLIDHARARGVPVREVAAHLDALAGRETWLLSAYQGVRLVTGWVGADLEPGPGARFAAWRDALETGP